MKETGLVMMFVISVAFARLEITGHYSVEGAPTNWDAQTVSRAIEKPRCIGRFSIERRKTKIKVIIRANQLKLIHVHIVDEKTCANEARLVPSLTSDCIKKWREFFFSQSPYLKGGFSLL